MKKSKSSKILSSPKPVKPMTPDLTGVRVRYEEDLDKLLAAKYKAGYNQGLEDGKNISLYVVATLMLFVFLVTMFT